MWQADSALIGHAQHTLRLNIFSDRAFNKFGNLFLGEREQLIVYRYFQDSSSFGQFHLTGRNTYGRKQERAATAENFCDACQHALCPPHSADTHTFGPGRTFQNGSDCLWVRLDNWLIRCTRSSYMCSSSSDIPTYIARFSASDCSSVSCASSSSSAFCFAGSN